MAGEILDRRRLERLLESHGFTEGIADDAFDALCRLVAYNAEEVLKVAMLASPADSRDLRGEHVRRAVELVRRLPTKQLLRGEH